MKGVLRRAGEGAFFCFRELDLERRCKVGAISRCAFAINKFAILIREWKFLLVRGFARRDIDLRSLGREEQRRVRAFAHGDVCRPIEGPGDRFTLRLSMFEDQAGRLGQGFCDRISGLALPHEHL